MQKAAVSLRIQSLPSRLVKNVREGLPQDAEKGKARSMGLAQLLLRPRPSWPPPRDPSKASVFHSSIIKVLYVQPVLQSISIVPIYCYEADNTLPLHSFKACNTSFLYPSSASSRAPTVNPSFLPCATKILPGPYRYLLTPFATFKFGTSVP